MHTFLENDHHVEMSSIAKTAIDQDRDDKNDKYISKILAKSTKQSKDSFFENFQKASHEAYLKLTNPKILSKRIYGEEVVVKEDLEKEIENAKRLASLYQEYYSYFHHLIFPGLPEHYPLKKKLIMTKNNSYFGNMWDVSQILLSILACFMYVSELHVYDYDSEQMYAGIEVVITQFFLIDFLFNWFVANSLSEYFSTPLVIIDILTIAPVYIGMIFEGASRANLSIFRFIRILRLIRILRAFRLLRGLSGIKKQVLSLILTLLSLIFMASGIVHLMENEIKQQMFINCNYINEATHWLPSCEETIPTYYDDSCDCQEFKCNPSWGRYDNREEPSNVKCDLRSFFVCFYYIIVTIATVGYGDYSPTHDYSRAVTIIFIVASMILIPLQINQLNELLAMKSAFREPYVPTTDSSHIIICGYVNNRIKLERFAKEFFHPDRTISQDVRAVILSTSEPREDVKNMLLSPVFDSKLFFIIGSPLNATDLVRARADIAIAIFFLCNSEITENNVEIDDASIILSTLSVNNFNPSLECFVQILKPGSRDVLKDSKLEVMVCLDELKTILQARNSICHGLSTLIELLFMSFGTVQDKSDPWYSEYLKGASGETYLIPLNYEYIETLKFQWTLITEGLFIEFGCLLIGVCNVRDQKVCLNPDFIDLKNFKSGQDFFSYYNVGIIIADEQSMAASIGNATSDENYVNRILEKLVAAEKSFSVRIGLNTNKKRRSTSSNRERRSSSQQVSSQDSFRKSMPATFQIISTEKVDMMANTTIQELITSNVLYNSNSVESHMNIAEDSESDSSQDSILSDAEEEEFLGELQPIKVSRKKRSKSDEENILDSPGKKNSISSKNSLIKSFLMRSMSISSKSNRDRGKSTDILDLFKSKDGKFIHREKEDAGDIDNHVIVFGSMTHLYLFVVELRRNVVCEIDFHPIIVVSEEVPPEWDRITRKFREVYLIRGNIANSSTFNKTNVKFAYSMVSLAKREYTKKSEDDNLDAETLFTFLKLESHIPPNVFFTVELICPPNLAVLNSSVMKRAKQNFNFRAITKDILESTMHKREANPLLNARPLNNRRQGSGAAVGTFMLKKKNIMKPPAEKNEPKPEVKPVNKPKKPKEIVDVMAKRKALMVDPKGGSGGASASTSFWDATNTHHILPVFASGIAFVPSTFDTILCQSFYNTLIPSLCEAMVCGQNHKSIFLIKVPPNYIGMKFGNIFRAFNSRNLLILGIYRAATIDDNSLLPFVYLSPFASSIMHEDDKVYVVGNPKTLQKALMTFEIPLVPGNEEGTWYLGNIPS